MTTVNKSTVVLTDASGPAAFLIELTAWLGDPAVLTAIASLLTAIAAILRIRRRKATERVEEEGHVEMPLSRAYSALHQVEESLREELVQQIEHLQEEAERIHDDLTRYRRLATVLEQAIRQCPEPSCPLRASRDDQR